MLPLTVVGDYPYRTGAHRAEEQQSIRLSWTFDFRLARDLAGIFPGRGFQSGTRTLMQLQLQLNDENEITDG
ncbi:hypothetical protein quinque_011220 [Culex quinquefasciatus]